MFLDLHVFNVISGGATGHADPFSAVLNFHGQPMDMKLCVHDAPLELAARMKAEAPYAVPPSDDVIAILNALPRFNRGEHLFSMRFGKDPMTASSVPKKRLDAAMLAVHRKGATDDKAAAKINLERSTFTIYYVHAYRIVSAPFVMT